MTSSHTIAGVDIPDFDTVLAALPAELVDAEPDVAARIRLGYVFAGTTMSAAELERAISLLRAKAAGDSVEDPFGPRIEAETFDDLVAIAERALAGGGMDIRTALAVLYRSGSIAAIQGRRLILFLGLHSDMRRIIWEHAAAEIERRGLDAGRYVEVGQWLLRWTELASLAIGEGFRATERDLVERDAAARQAALDELFGSMSTDGRAAARIRRLAMRYGLDPDATYRVVAIQPGADADPTPDEPGFDDADLDRLARRIDGLLRRQGSDAVGAGAGLRLPLAMSWRGAIVAVLGRDRREWLRLKDAATMVLGPDGTGGDAADDGASPTWTAIATTTEGVRDFGRALAELQEGIRVSREIGRHGLIDDLAELAVERLLLSDPHLAETVIEREIGALMADPRMGDELVETLQVYFDTGGNRRETARRLHLADRTIAYRLERAEQLLGHGFDGDAGRRLNVALTLRRIEGNRVHD